MTDEQKTIQSLERVLEDLKDRERIRFKQFKPSIQSLVMFCKTLAPHERLLIVRGCEHQQPYGEAIEIESFSCTIPDTGVVELKVRPR